ncbi:chromate transporter [Clostridia bacterium]|nr:chromate transporter [Clostridia bacterium]
MIILQLFYEFAKIGLFAIGGGLATLPFLQALSESTGWFSAQDLINMIAVSESTPGPIGINMATYVGYTTAGVPGAIVATLGEVLPSLIIVLFVAKFLKAFSENKVVKAVFYGVRAASVGLIAAAGYSVLTIALLDIEAFRTAGEVMRLFQWKALALAVVLYLVMLNKKWKIHPIAAIAGSAVVGIVFRFGGV